MPRTELGSGWGWIDRSGGLPKGVVLDRWLTDTTHTTHRVTQPQAGAFNCKTRASQSQDGTSETTPALTIDRSHVMVIMERRPRRLPALLVVLLSAAALAVVEAFVAIPLQRPGTTRPLPLLPPAVARRPLLHPLLQLSPQRDPRPASAGLEDGEEAYGLVGASPVAALVRSHAVVMRALCPSVSGCRVFLPSDLLLLDPPDDEEEDYEDEDGRSRRGLGQEGVDWRLEDAALDVYLAACEPVAGGGGNFLARPREGPLPAALLAPFGVDGWIAVELMGPARALPVGGSSSGGDDGNDEGWRALAPALECLRTALAVAGKERAAGQRVQGTFRRLLREIRQPLGTLRTFGKLLLRRLEKTDAEGLNQELTSNVLVSSDALVEVLHRFEGRQDDEEEGEYRGTPPQMPEPSQLAPSGQGSGARTGASSARALCDPRTVLAPILAAAQAISARDGVQFQCYIEEGLPRILIDERGFQEALGTMIELALASSLAGAVAAAAGAADPQPNGPALSLEVASRGKGKGIEIVVRDNGLGDTSMRGGKELGRAREAIERMGARLEIRRSASLGGTHMSILVD